MGLCWGKGSMSAAQAPGYPQKEQVNPLAEDDSTVSEDEDAPQPKSILPLLAALIAAQQTAIAKDDTVTAWRQVSRKSGHFEPATVRNLNSDGTYNVKYHSGKCDEALSASKILESKPQLLNYKPLQDGSHLKLGVQPQGLLMLLEQIGFIWFDGESEAGKHAEERFGKYSLMAAGCLGPNKTGWRYTKLYSRGDFPAIKYADEAYGPVKPHYGFNWCGLFGYDAEAWIRRWLQTNGRDGKISCGAGTACTVKGKKATIRRRLDNFERLGEDGEPKPRQHVDAYEVEMAGTGEVIKLERNEMNVVGSYEGLSLLEVALSDDHFASIRPFIGRADAFLSHADRESCIGKSTHNGNPEYPSTMQMLQAFDENDKDFDLPSKRLWIDYTSLRPCQREWNPEKVVNLVADLGVVVALIDPDLAFLSRSWCIFEIYCAARAMIEHGGTLYCPIGNGFREQAKKARVDSAAAQCSSTKDKQDIDGFITEQLGSHTELDRIVTEALLKSNDILARDRKTNEYIHAGASDGDDHGQDLWEPVYSEHGSARDIYTVGYRRFVDGYKHIWKYDHKRGQWVSRKPTAEEKGQWDPLLDKDLKLVRNKWRYEGAGGRGEWVHEDGKQPAKIAKPRMTRFWSGY